MTELSPPPAHTPYSRFQLLPSPLVAPGKCACCGTVTRPVVDFAMTIEFYGAVYFCETCITEAASVIGMVTREVYDEARAGSTQSFTAALDEQGLKVVTNGQYDTIAVAVARLSDIFLFSGASDSPVPSAPAGEAEPTLFDPVEGDDVLINEGNASGDGDTSGNVEQSDDGPVKDKSGNARTAKQKHDAPVGKGPASVSGSSGDGNSFVL